MGLKLCDPINSKIMPSKFITECCISIICCQQLLYWRYLPITIIITSYTAVTFHYINACYNLGILLIQKWQAVVIYLTQNFHYTKFRTMTEKTRFDLWLVSPWWKIMQSLLLPFGSAICMLIFMNEYTYK